MNKVNNKILNRKYLISTNILLLLVIVILVIYVVRDNENEKTKHSILRDSSVSFPLTNPILDCENNFSGEELTVQSKIINEKVSDLKNKHSLSHISLYFRDLNNGPWIGINEKEEFAPASLLKVPVMIAFLRNAEDNPSLLEKKITIEDKDINKSLIPNFVFDNLLEVGKSYSLLEVSRAMIQKSDNTGVIVLLKNMKLDYIKSVFDSVGVPFKDTSTEVPVRVKDYAGFFRVLYNSSYLNRQMSEMALEILSSGEYMSGLRKGVPSNIVVAHKFGERAVSGEKDSIQLHDCGIIYYPQKPYLLCVMTHGSNFESQEDAIEELASFIYEEVDKITDGN